jgi:DNA-binding XRE family transcriptional regulator
MTPPPKEMPVASPFKLWRLHCDLTQREAAALLRLGLRTVQVFDAGVSNHTGEPVSPSYAERIAMRLYAEERQLPCLADEKPFVGTTTFDRRTPDDDAFRRRVGRNIRLARYAVGMSQNKLGDALGLTFQAIQRYEKGEISVSVKLLLAMSAVLKKPPMFFVPELAGAVGND